LAGDREAQVKEADPNVNVKWQDVWRLATYLRPQWAAVAATMFVLIGDSLLKIVPPYLTKVALDDHVLAGDLEGLQAVILMYAGSIVAGFALEVLRVVMLQWTGQRTILSLRMGVFEKLLGMSQGFFHRKSQGDLLSTVLSDVEVINDLFTQGMVVLLSDVVLLAGICVAFFVLDWRLAVAVLSVMPLLVVATLIYRRGARDAHRAVRSHVGGLNAYLHENVNGMTTVQLFNLQEKNHRRFQRMNSMLLHHQLRAITYTSLFFPFVEVVSAVSLGVIIWYGGGMVVEGMLMPGVLVAFIQYLRRFFQPIRDMAEKYDLLQAALAASERVFSLMDQEVGIKDSPHSILPTEPKGEVIFRGVWFCYEPSHWVLKGLDLTLQPGKTTALVGITGAGKSSLIQLMNRVQEPQKGEILIDGVEVREWRLKDLRRHVGVIPQDVFMLDGSVLENLRLWNEDIPDHRVREMAEALGVDEFIRSLPHGYNAEIRPKGENLSMGQRQLLALVRAFLYNPRILVLDEATSGVDPLTEALLQRAMERIFKGRTTLVIAHRLSTVQKCDQIVVLHEGRVVEQGTHLRLLEAGGRYRRFLQLQVGAEGTPQPV
jgi:ATP-binding cassette subfamily B protein